MRRRQRPTCRVSGDPRRFVRAGFRRPASKRAATAKMSPRAAGSGPVLGVVALGVPAASPARRARRPFPARAALGVHGRSAEPDDPEERNRESGGLDTPRYRHRQLGAHHHDREDGITSRPSSTSSSEEPTKESATRGRRERRARPVRRSGSRFRRGCCRPRSRGCSRAPRAVIAISGKFVAIASRIRPPIASPSRRRCQHVDRIREVDARKPDRSGRRKKEDEERNNAQAREHVRVLQDGLSSWRDRRRPRATRLRLIVSLGNARNSVHAR